ncbi:hypothetical protein CDD82_6811 [Ophiocordyceps australis]|uniref:Uncharacterized protein n=1 Tax=Ophiocordyceps australis TaxID=1399860 RepID=A0A2C5YTA9_9HYPO|nr:hypothetical protein CDD82_6811 [Ophiocordyceps australis]
MLRILLLAAGASALIFQCSKNFEQDDLLSVINAIDTCGTPINEGSIHCFQNHQANTFSRGAAELGWRMAEWEGYHNTLFNFQEYVMNVDFPKLTTWWQSLAGVLRGGQDFCWYIRDLDPHKNQDLDFLSDHLGSVFFVDNELREPLMDVVDDTRNVDVRKGSRCFTQDLDSKSFRIQALRYISSVLLFLEPAERMQRQRELREKFSTDLMISATLGRLWDAYGCDDDIQCTDKFEAGLVYLPRSGADFIQKIELAVEWESTVCFLISQYYLDRKRFYIVTNRGTEQVERKEDEGEGEGEGEDEDEDEGESRPKFTVGDTDPPVVEGWAKNYWSSAKSSKGTERPGIYHGAGDTMSQSGQGWSRIKWNNAGPSGSSQGGRTTDGTGPSVVGWQRGKGSPHKSNTKLRVDGVGDVDHVQGWSKVDGAMCTYRGAYAYRVLHKGGTRYMNLRKSTYLTQVQSDGALRDPYYCGHIVRVNITRSCSGEGLTCITDKGSLRGRVLDPQGVMAPNSPQDIVPFQFCEDIPKLPVRYRDGDLLCYRRLETGQPVLLRCINSTIDSTARACVGRHPEFPDGWFDLTARRW